VMIEVPCAMVVVVTWDVVKVVVVQTEAGTVIIEMTGVVIVGTVSRIVRLRVIHLPVATIIRHRVPRIKMFFAIVVVVVVVARACVPEMVMTMACRGVWSDEHCEGSQ